MGLELIFGIVLGIAIGFGVSLFNNDDGDSSKVKNLQAEHDKYRKQVDDHFVNTAVLFKGLTEQYRDVYRHVASGAGELCSEEAKALQADLEETALLAHPIEEVEVSEESAEAAEMPADEATADEATADEATVDEATVDEGTEETVADSANEAEAVVEEAEPNEDDVPLASEVEMSADIAEKIKSQAAKNK